MPELVAGAAMPPKHRWHVLGGAGPGLLSPLLLFLLAPCS